MTTTKKTPTKQSKREAKAAEKAKTKKAAPAKSTSKGKFNYETPQRGVGLFLSPRGFTSRIRNHSPCSEAKSTASKKDAAPAKKTRKKRDADAPKKPMSAFFWYQQTRRNPIKQERPTLVHKEVIVVSINPFVKAKSFPLAFSSILAHPGSALVWGSRSHQVVWELQALGLEPRIFWCPVSGSDFELLRTPSKMFVSRL